MSHSTEKRLMQSKKPRWSLLTSFWVFLGIVVVSTVTVLLTSKRELWLELEIVAGIVAAVVFLFYWWVLYHGIDFDENERLTFSGVQFDVVDPGLDIADLASGADDPISFIAGIILGLLLSVVLAIFVSLLVWLGVNGIALAVMLIATPLFAVFRTSVQFVLRNAPACHGDLVTAAQYSAMFTVIKTAWIFLVIFGAHYITASIRPM
jgi:hypothetical protein